MKTLPQFALPSLVPKGPHLKFVLMHTPMTATLNVIILEKMMWVPFIFTSYHTYLPRYQLVHAHQENQTLTRSTKDKVNYYYLSQISYLT